MAKLFLGSVGSVEAFERKEDGSYELAFVSKTLTDSGINTTISKEDIRGGTGAPIQFSFYHDPSVEITLTDVVFKEEYLEAQLGAEFVTNDDPHSYASETRTSDATGNIDLEGTVLQLKSWKKGEASRPKVASTVEYQQDGYRMFEEMIADIDYDATRLFMKSEIRQNIKR